MRESDVYIGVVNNEKKLRLKRKRLKNLIKSKGRDEGLKGIALEDF